MLVGVQELKKTVGFFVVFCLLTGSIDSDLFLALLFADI